jgi:hypothetical protein
MGREILVGDKNVQKTQPKPNYQKRRDKEWRRVKQFFNKGIGGWVSPRGHVKLWVGSLECFPLDAGGGDG